MRVFHSRLLIVYLFGIHLQWIIFRQYFISQSWVYLFINVSCYRCFMFIFWFVLCWTVNLVENCARILSIALSNGVRLSYNSRIRRMVISSIGFGGSLILLDGHDLRKIVFQLDVSAYGGLPILTLRGMISLSSRLICFSVMQALVSFTSISIHSYFSITQLSGRGRGKLQLSGQCARDTKPIILDCFGLPIRSWGYWHAS